MNNAEKFRDVFGFYATELWAMPEKDFLKWLNDEYEEEKEKIIKLLQEEFFDIWDCEIDHRRFQNTVGEILVEAVEIITKQF